MPPRYAYWTILIDGQATAFRARDREELLPTFNQLARKNSDIVMKYFARGRLWDTPEQAQWASRNRPAKPIDKRERDWRPGGQHRDPRARFEKRPDRRPHDKAGPPRESQPKSFKRSGPRAQKSDARAGRPWRPPGRGPGRKPR
jgi:hypothetical protein